MIDDELRPTMNRCYSIVLPLLACTVVACEKAPDASNEIEPLGTGPYSVGSTNLQVAAEYAGMGDDAMHEYLLGRADESGQPRYLADILEYPDSAWITDVAVPDDAEIYGPASGSTLPVVTFLAYPSSAGQQQDRYAFPYHDARYGVFEDMLAPNETPSFADPNNRYPLIIIAHGASAHGLYDVRHAHHLASHGFIVAVITYGDDRTGEVDEMDHHISFLRPLLTRAVVDELLESEDFGSNIDADNIGITGHSFGGFTALAIAGGRYLGNTGTVRDTRIKASAVAAPWVGGNYGGSDFFAFGPNNLDLSHVDIPTICFFGTNDDVTSASFILPAMKRLSGPTYVVELVDQPHVFEPGSWEDRNTWELLFFSAYLQHDQASLAALRTARSAKGGNEDFQLFDYQSTQSAD